MRLTRRTLLGGLAAASLPIGRAAAAGPGGRQRWLKAGLDRSDGLAGFAAAKGILFGTEVRDEVLTADPALADVVTEDAALVVPGLELKWPALRPSADRYDFAAADRLLQFTETAGLGLRGHTLVWHEVIPDWLKREAEAGRLKQRVDEHIARVVGHYAGKMHSWDVANEVLEPRHGQPGGLRNSMFLKALGPGYIEAAFRTAAKADPGALLCINEYDLEYDHPQHESRRQAMLALLTDLVSRGVPVHALGIQAHLEVGKYRFDPGLLRAFLAKVTKLGLQIFITELDVNDRALPPDEIARDRAVAAHYGEFLAAALAEPAVTTVLTWGLSDKYSWLSTVSEQRRADGRPTRGLPYDENLIRKPAWQAIADAFAKAPARS